MCDLPAGFSTKAAGKHSQYSSKNKQTFFGGLSTGQLNCCLPRMEEKREERLE